MSLISFSTALIDANVLYSAAARDYLLNLAQKDLFKPKWTNTIHEEWIRNLLKKRPDIKRIQLERLQKAMDGAFPEANVMNYKAHFKELTLPDPNDHHVLAAAIGAGADYIVTNNIKDFPKKILNTYNITAIHPDDFLTEIIKLHPIIALEAFVSQIERLKSPPFSEEDVLNMFKKLKLTKTVSILRTLL